MTRRPERVDFDSAHAHLRVLLRSWDPIGVFQERDQEFHAPEDEYDCLIPGLYKRLRAGEREEELAAFLEHELVDHYGVQALPDADRKCARELVSWWDGRARRRSEA